MDKVTRFYNSIWQDFKVDQNDEATSLLFKRWTCNKAPFSLIENKTVLDMGCGSGRYSCALLRLGAKEVVGVDMHKPRLKEKGFSFKKGSVLGLPFKGNSFDFVFCNGVLHHTKNWKKGVAEAFRVLKPGGWLWLYVVGNSKVWGYSDRIRKKVGRQDAEAFKKFLLARGWPANKVFFLLDCFFTPHREYISKKEVETQLKKSGFAKIRHLSKDIEKGPKNLHLRFLAQKAK